MKLSMEQAQDWMDKNLAEEMLHSYLGASGGDRWIACPGSYNAQKGYGNTTSIFAAEGTFAHAFSELLRQFEVPAVEYIGLTGTVDGFDFTVDHDMADHIQGFVDRAAEFGGDPYYEITVDYSQWAQNAETQGFGTADDIRIKEGVCKITDLKYGKGISVYAEDNTQGKLYALGVYAEYQHLYDIEEFIICIDQPRKDSYNEWTISTADLLKWGTEVVLPASIETTADDPAFKAGDHCKWCRARHRCMTRAEEVIGIYDSGKVILDNDGVAAVLPMLDQIRKWADDIAELALSELAKGHKIGDYKMVEGRSNRGWTDEALVVKALKRAKIKVADIFTKKLVSIGAAEKLLGKSHEIFFNKELVKKPAGKPVMVPGDDKREALALKAEDEFTD